MDYKKGLLGICIILCILLCVSAVSANENITSDSSSDNVILQNNSQVQVNTYDEGLLSQSQDDDVLGASTIYFDASASSDGDGSKSSPYKYVTNNRLVYGVTAYFANGVYEIDECCFIASSSTSKATFIGQGQNTVIKSNLINKYSFSVGSDAYFVLKDITLDNVHIRHQGYLEANNVIFRNSVGFEGENYQGLNYAYKYYAPRCGGVIICDTPSNKLTYVTLNNCRFSNDYSDSGGVIATYKSIVNINNCIFTNCYSSRFGGVIYGNSSNITVRSSTFNNNHAKYGGNIYSKNGNLKVYDSNFYYSKAESFGGAIAIDTVSSIVDNCTFSNYQSSTDAGGAIYAINSTLNVYYSSFSKGASYYGGAICNLKTDFILLGSEFIDNYAENYGGSIYNAYGNIDILGNNFINSHASSGGAICSRLSDYLNLDSNTFINTTAIKGQIVFVDGDEGSVFEKENVYKNLYNLVCGYEGTLNGNSFSLYSNYLTFSISNDGNYIIPVIDDVTQPLDHSDYANFRISAEYYPDSLIYTDVDQYNRILFNLTKYANAFNDENLNVFIIDEAGDVIFSGTLSLYGNKNYTNNVLFDLNFKELMLALRFGNLYSLNAYGSVPLFNYTVTSNGALPSKYDSRDYGYITPVKDQKEGGNCWAFAGIATLEACIKKATGITYDFSEENAKNLMAAYSLFGWDMETNDGGNLYMFMAYLNSWFGPTYEEYDVYDDYSALSILYDSIFHIQDVYCLPDRENSNDNDIVKRAIVDYGAVSIATKWIKGSHAITLVGWDDEYVGYDFFENKCSGAWIFKNSYGEDWKDHGFYYLSYEHTFYNAYTFIFNENRPYSKIYQYDFAGRSTSIGFGTDTVYYKNKFTSAGNEILSAFSTYFYVPSDYTASVYLNGKFVTSQSGHCLAGYYTIPLIKEVQLAKGDEFVIEIKITASNSFLLPVCRENNINRISYVNNISFFSLDGKTWYDLYDYEMNIGGKMYTHQVACIKAFTRQKSQNQIEISVNQLSNVKVNEKITITATVPEYYVLDGYRHYLEGFITFTINDEYYYAQIKNGKASLDMSFDKVGLYTLTAQYISNLEISNKVMFNFNVGNKVEDNIVIKASNVNKYYGGSQKYNVKVTNNGAAVSGASVKVTVVETKYSTTVKTDSNGQASLDLNLNPGTYTIKSEYDGKSCTSKYIVESTISVSDSVTYYSNQNVAAFFLDSNGNDLSNKEVIFKIGNKQFKATTAANGYATALTNLNAGTYDVTVVNSATGEQKQAKLEIYKSSTSCLVTIYQNDNKVKITATLNPTSATGYVDLIFNDVSYRLAVVNGVVNKEFTNLQEGKYYFSAVYSGDDNYLESSSFNSFTVKKTNYVLHVYENGYTYYGGGMGAVLYDENENGVSGEVIKFTLGNKTDYITTDVTGWADYDVSKFPVGNYTFIIEYNGQSYLSNLEIRSTIPQIVFGGEYSKATVTASFINIYGFELSNKEVIFKIGNTQFKSTTDSNGVATANVNLNAGSYTLTAINSETGEEKQMDIVIRKANPQITLTKSINENSVTLTATLNPTNPSGNVIFTVSEKKYTVSVKNGKATLTLTDLDSGTYSATAKYAGDTNYNNVLSSTVSFTISTPTITLTAPDLTKYYGGPERFTVTVKDNGNPVVDAVVKLNFQGYIYNLTTNSNGVASIGTNLKPGTYSLTASYNGKSVTSHIIIKSTIISSDVYCEYSNPKINAIMLNQYGEVISGELTSFEIAGTTYSKVSNSKGEVSFNLGMYSPGIYSGIITNPITNETKIIKLSISKATPTLTLKVIERNGKDSLMASLSKTDATGTITFVCDDEEYPTGILDGISYLTFANAGTFDVDVNYSGDDNYNPVSGYIKVVTTKSPKITPTLSLEKVEKDGKDAVKASLSYYSATGTITFVVNGVEYPTSISNGVSYFILSNAGTYDITARYSGDDTFNPVSRSITVVSTKSSKQTPTLTLKHVEKEGKDAVRASLSPNTATGTITFVVNGLKYSTEISDGISYFTFSNAGTYDVTAEYSGDASYNPVSKSINVVATKSPKVTLVLTLVKVERDGKDAVKASLSSTSATGTITFAYDGKEYPVAVSGGVSYLTLSNAGSYWISAKYSGDSKYDAVSKSIAVVATKSPKATPTLTLETVKDDGKDALKATLSSTSATGTITFHCNDEDYPSEISDGISYLIFSSPGTYDVDVEYSGDSYLNPVSKSIKVTFESETYLIVDDLDKVYGDSKKFTIMVVDDDGNPISNYPVDLDILDGEGNLYQYLHRVSDSNGYIKVNFNYKPDTYEVNIFDNDGNYMDSADVTVKKAAAKITASAKKYKVKATKKYTVTLKSSKNVALKKKKVTLKVNGKTYTAKTNSNGKATFTLSKLTKKGKFTAKVQFGDKYYKTVTKRVKITVK